MLVAVAMRFLFLESRCEISPRFTDISGHFVITLSCDFMVIEVCSLCDREEFVMGTPKQENNNVVQVTNSVKKTYGKIILTLKNCLLPDDKLTPTPSQVDGLDQETEIDLRVLGCELIQTAGILLKLPQVAMATGQVLFQRFYYSKSFVRHAMETTAMGCVYLASKIEETPRRIRDVINVFHHIKQVKGQKCRSAGELATQGSGGVTASHAHSAPPKARHDTSCSSSLSLFCCLSLSSPS